MRRRVFFQMGGAMIAAPLLQTLGLRPSQAATLSTVGVRLRMPGHDHHENITTVPASVIERLAALCGSQETFGATYNVLGPTAGAGIEAALPLMPISGGTDSHAWNWDTAYDGLYLRRIDRLPARCDITIGYWVTINGQPIPISAGDMPVQAGDEVLIDWRGDVSGVDISPKPYLDLRASPNPFSHETTISIILPEPVALSVEVFSVRGGHIRTLVAGQQKEPGEVRISWDGRDEGGRRLPQGAYYVRVFAGAINQNRQLILLH